MSIRIGQHRIKNFMDGGFVQAQLLIFHPAFPEQGLLTQIESDGPNTSIAYQIAFSNWLFYEFPLLRHYCLKSANTNMVKVLELITPIRRNHKQVLDWTCYLSNRVDPSKEDFYGSTDFDRSFFNLFLDEIPQLLIAQQGVVLFHIELTNHPELGITPRVTCNGVRWEAGELLLKVQLKRTPMIRNTNTLSQRFLCTSNERELIFQFKPTSKKKGPKLWRKIWKSA
ncbi:MAG: hypothetical protein AAF598_22080 [Bacteroidota bacterium]